MAKTYFTLGIISLIMIAAVSYIFVKVGSPGEQRDMKVDEQKASEMLNLSHEIENYYYSNNTLPANLEVLLANKAGYIDSTILDQLDYKLISESEYEICATFATDSKLDRYNSSYGIKYTKGYYCEKTKI